MPAHLRPYLQTLPVHPGVYLYKDAKGRILYVGKAKNLKSRVRSYFRQGETITPSPDLDPSKQRMVPKIHTIETISTDNETEALILEANLIRQHQPPYNVILRDDKYYLFIKITTPEETPRIFPVRRLKNDGARYFGPYSSASSVHHTLNLLRRLFPYRTEKDAPRDIIFPHPLFDRSLKKPVGSLPASLYRQNIQNIMNFLKGDRQRIIETVRAGMKSASAAKKFEQAAIFRNQLRALERLEGNQKVYLSRPENFDMVGLSRRGNQSAANVFSIRRGKLLNKNTFLLTNRAAAPDIDIIRQFVLQYYRDARDIPPQIYLPAELSDALAIAAWINPPHPPEFSVPLRGKKRQLLDLGRLNAEHLLLQEEARFITDSNLKKALVELAGALGMPGNPLHRIEAYDVSNTQGTLATGSLVTFTNGRPDKSQYKKFRLKLTGEPNDFAMMQEILRRRFAARNQAWKQPDLILIDGGKGQLSSALKVLREYGLELPLASLAKREEELFLPGRPDPIRLPYNSSALFLIQRLRDEAHRFTITYHRLLRSKQQHRSILDEVPGLGPKTKKSLLNRFGSLKAIRATSEGEIARVIGPAKARLLKDFL